jgi:hypothetical protein
MINVEKYIKDQIAIFQANEALENREQRARAGQGGRPVLWTLLDSFPVRRALAGTPLPKLVGRRLGWQVFDNEIVDEIAKKAHIRRQLIESLDERDQAMIQDMIGQLLNLQD